MPEPAKEVQPDVITEQVADAIVKISDAIKKMQSGRLTQKAILLLISHASGVSQRDVREVLDGIARMEKLYLKPTKAVRHG